MRFTALQDFVSEEMGSSYAKGMSYTVRAPEQVVASLGAAPEKVIALARGRAEQLPALVEQWIAEGKVAAGGPAAEMDGGN